ncbi:glycosyltransferase family 2 protein [Algoriphagus taiwanensis]|uniref:Glycosyltransferase 2-like domain-containing protein n=1 Tax=Algoriphagus taiwanensis TaxID=1445656 RepID=A0ABQ6Q6I9_9BACT|nr:hypothetical protein Ataiwa_39940 [Algoriphagus taiwanensis]
MSNSLVSVVMIAYNHRPYIVEALQGVLCQEGDFEMEIILSDDNSTDGMEEVIIGFINDNPRGECIRYTRHDKNIGMMKNLIWSLNQCKGEFIAICEGDDFWIDPTKLQCQISFLKSNPDFSLTYHPALVLEKNGNLVEDFIAERNFYAEVSNRLDLAIFGNYIHTPTVVFRNYRFTIPSFFEKLKIGDYFLYLLISKYGKIKRFPQNFAVYRNEVGVFSSQSMEKKRNDFKMSIRTFYKECSDFQLKIILFLRFNYSNLFDTNRKFTHSNLPTNIWDCINYISVISFFKSLRFFIFRHEYKRVYGIRFPR